MFLYRRPDLGRWRSLGQGTNVDVFSRPTVAEATGEPEKRATLIPDPPNGFEAKPTADDLSAYSKA